MSCSTAVQPSQETSGPLCKRPRLNDAEPSVDSRIPGLVKDLKDLVNKGGGRSNSKATRTAEKLKRIAFYEDQRKAIIAEGAFEPLIDLLHNGPPVCQAHVCAVLGYLFVGHEKRLVADGAVPILLSMCRRRHAECILQALQLLSNLVRVDSIRAMVFHAGALHILLVQALKGESRARAAAVKTLSHLAAAEPLRRSMLDEGVLGNMANCFGDDDLEVKKWAALCVRNLLGADACTGAVKAVKKLLPPLVALLRSDDPQCEIAAASCLERCASIPALCSDLAATEAAASLEALVQKGAAAECTRAAVEALKLLGRTDPRSEDGVNAVEIAQ